MRCVAVQRLTSAPSSVAGRKYDAAMPKTSPKVFISHAGEDQEFVLDLGAQLRSSGLDAWVSAWELLPGDSLVRGILERGIAQSSCFVIVLSHASLAKPWVQKELDVAIERSVAEEYRIIPVLLDGLTREDVPTGLRDVLWLAHKTVAETAFEINRSIQGLSTRPPLGGLAAHLAGASSGVTMAENPDDDLVLRSLLREYSVHVDPTSYLNYFTDDLARHLESETGLPVEAFDESVHELNHKGILRADRMAGHTPGRWLIRDIPGTTWWAFGLSEQLDMEDIARRLLIQLMNDQSFRRVHEFQGLPFWVVKTACWWLCRQGFIRYDHSNSGIFVKSIEPGAKRWMRSAM